MQDSTVSTGGEIKVGIERMSTIVNVHSGLRTHTSKFIFME